MKTIKNILSVVFWGMLIPMLLTSCTDKKAAKNSVMDETTAKTESAIKVAAPPFDKFVVVTTEDAGLYKTADTNSPNLVRWIESDCESDVCDNFYQWSDQPGKTGFELSTEILAWEGRVFPVLGEEGDFFKISTLDEWCTIESAYIPKACVGDIESAPIKADMLEDKEFYLKCCVVKDGKYKDVVLFDEYDELNGETLHVGVLINGVVATPLVYKIDCSMAPQQEEDIVFDDSESIQFLKYNKSLAVTAEEEYESYQLDPKKLNAEQIAKIVDGLTSQKPEYVSGMYHFPAMGLQSFIYKAK